MPTFLVPVDFSATSDNALRYAFQLAKLQNAKIELIHAYPIPITAPDMPAEMVLTEQIVEDARQRMDALVTSQKIGADVQTKLVAGAPGSEVVYHAEQHRTDLIVMGTHGASQGRSSWLGSNTMRVIERSVVPVLAIPEYVTYKPWKKICVATDFDHHEIDAIKSLSGWVRLFNADLILVHINDGNGKNDTAAYRESFIEKVRQMTNLKSIQYEYVPANINLVDELREFAVFHQADALVMLHHVHKGLSRLWHRSLTKEIAKELPIPLFSIPIQKLEAE